MKVYPPSDNPITGTYTDTHRAYDRAGLNLPDELRAGMDGQIIEVVNQYNSNWINNGTLTTKDYGNYIIIRHTDGTRELHAHLKKDSMLPLGTNVKAGQVVARIGNTGNSTGPHVHSEYRDAQNRNIQVEFSKDSPTAPMNDALPKKLTDHHAEWKTADDILKYEQSVNDNFTKKDNAIKALGLDPQNLQSSFDALIAKVKADCQVDDKYSRYGHAVADLIKNVP